MSATVSMLLSPRRAARGRFTQARLIAAALLAAAGLCLVLQGLWIPAKAALAQILLERAFTETVRTGAPVKPWAWLDSWPVARIEVPRLKLRAVALAGGSGQALAFGPAHLAGTPAPGERGTSVLAAHRDTQFQGLDRIRPGDEIAVTRGDGRHVMFAVTRTEVVRFDRSGIDPHASGHKLVLATCWPLDAMTRGPERLLVHAEMVTEEGRR